MTKIKKNAQLPTAAPNDNVEFYIPKTRTNGQGTKYIPVSRKNVHGKGGFASYHILPEVYLGENELAQPHSEQNNSPEDEQLYKVIEIKDPAQMASIKNLPKKNRTTGGKPYSLKIISLEKAFLKHSLKNGVHKKRPELSDFSNLDENAQQAAFNQKTTNYEEEIRQFVASEKGKEILERTAREANLFSTYGNKKTRCSKKIAYNSNTFDLYVFSYHAPGIRLSDLLREKSLTARQRLKIVELLVGKIADLHRQGILHYDIKPENINIEFDSEGNVVDIHIYDFGLSDSIENLRASALHDGIAFSGFSQDQDISKLPLGKHNTVYVFDPTVNELFYVDRKKMTLKKIEAIEGQNLDKLNTVFTVQCQPIFLENGNTLREVVGALEGLPRPGTRAYKPLESTRGKTAVFDPVNAEMFALSTTIFEILADQHQAQINAADLSKKLNIIRNSFFKQNRINPKLKKEFNEFLYDYVLSYYLHNIPLEKLRSTDTGIKKAKAIGLVREKNEIAFFDLLDACIGKNISYKFQYKGKKYDLSPNAIGLIHQFGKLDLGLAEGKHRALRDTLIRAQLAGQAGAHAFDAQTFADNICHAIRPKVKNKAVRITTGENLEGQIIVPRPSSHQKKFTLLAAEATPPEHNKGGYGSFHPGKGIYSAFPSATLKEKTEKGRFYAFKKIERDYDQSREEQLAEIFNEIKYLRRYGPGASYHVGEDQDGHFYIYLYQAPDLTLHHSIKDNVETCLPLLTRLNMFKAFNQKTGRMHADHKLHGDLKIKNLCIALNDDNSFRSLTLIDFGFSSSISRAKKAWKSCFWGSPGYLPIECFNRDIPANQSNNVAGTHGVIRSQFIAANPVNSEIFAKGIVALEMLTQTSIASLKQDFFTKLLVEISKNKNLYDKADKEDNNLYQQSFDSISEKIANYYLTGNSKLKNIITKEINFFYQTYKVKNFEQIVANILKSLEKTFYQHDDKIFQCSLHTLNLLQKFDSDIFLHLQTTMGKSKAAKLKDTLVKSLFNGQLKKNEALTLESFDRFIAETMETLDEEKFKVINENEIIELPNAFLNEPTEISANNESKIEIIERSDIDLKLDEIPEKGSNVPAETDKSESPYYSIFKDLLNHRSKQIKQNLQQKMNELKTKREKNPGDASSIYREAFLAQLILKLDEKRKVILSQAKTKFNAVEEDSDQNQHPQREQKPNMKTRPLSKLADESQRQGASERRTGVYMQVHEDSSTEATQLLTSAVEFRKRSNKKTKLSSSDKKAYEITIELSDQLERELNKLVIKKSEDKTINTPRSSFKMFIHEHLKFIRFISKRFYEWLTRPNTRKTLNIVQEKISQSFSSKSENYTRLPHVFFRVLKSLENSADKPNKNPPIVKPKNGNYTN